MSAAERSGKRIATNRKARRDYEVLESLEAGVELQGTEVKSVRTGKIDLSGAFARVEGNSVTLHSLNIPAYEHGNRFNHDPVRPRRLLLHRREIGRLRNQAEEKGYSLIPLNLYLKRGWVKIELGVCRGKSRGDKRETLRRKTVDRETSREIARHRKQRSATGA